MFSWITIRTVGVCLAAIVGVLGFLPLSTIHAAISSYPGFSRLPERTAYLFDQLWRIEHRTRTGFEVAWVGGSTTRESLWTPEMLAGELQQAMGKPATVYDLSSSAQSMEQSWALAETAACDGVDLIAIGINLDRLKRVDPNNPAFYFGTSPDDVSRYVSAHGNVSADFLAAFGFRRELLEEALEEIGLRLGRGMQGIAEPGPLPRHHYLSLTVSAARLKDELRELGRINMSKARWTNDLPLIRDAVERCGARLAIYLVPVRPALSDPVTSPGYAKAQQTLAADLGKQLGPTVFIFDANAALQLPDSAFFDWGHLHSPDAMKQTTAFIGQQLGAFAKTFRESPS